MSTKVAPIEFALVEFCPSASNCGPGRTRMRTSLKERTSAERLKDLRNDRREEDKRENTYPGLALATTRRYFYSERLPDSQLCDAVLTYAEDSASSAIQKTPRWMPHPLRFSKGARSLTNLPNTLRFRKYAIPECGTLPRRPP